MAMKARLASSSDDKPKKEKYDFEKMKLAAMSAEPSVRKQAFIEYFERFEEFPSFLFDNESGIDVLLRRTIDDLLKDPTTSKEVRKGLDSLLQRLPS
jgi:hypothetical protein